MRLVAKRKNKRKSDVFQTCFENEQKRSFFFWWVAGGSYESFLSKKARMAEQEYPPARSDPDRPGFTQYNTTTFLQSHAKSSDQLANGVRVAFGR